MNKFFYHWFQLFSTCRIIERPTCTQPRTHAPQQQSQACALESRRCCCCQRPWFHPLPYWETFQTTNKSFSINFCFLFKECCLGLFLDFSSFQVSRIVSNVVISSLSSGRKKRNAIKKEKMERNNTANTYFYSSLI